MRESIDMSEFTKHEDGSLPGGVLWIIATAMIFGIAVDSTNAWRAERQLQVASDASALVAAAHADDPATARAMAVELANINLGPDQTAITEADVRLGEYDAVSGTFSIGDTNANSAFVQAVRAGDRGNQLNTYLMWTSGVDQMDISAISFAASPENTPTCDDGTIITSDFLNSGGGNTWNGNICLHGKTGMRTGGNGYYSEDVRISADDIDTISFNTPREGSATEDQVVVERVMDPAILPNLTSMFDTYWNDAMPYEGSTYLGSELPSLADGAEVVHVTGNYITFKPPGSGNSNNPNLVEMHPNTIYLLEGGASFQGNLDVTNSVILAKGQIIIGGGVNLEFEDVMFFAQGQINASGNVAWGDPNSYCDTGNYNSYLFSLNRLSLGGNTSIYGVVGAAPSFNPGGAMNSSGGIYFEASTYTTLGGNYNVTGCGVPLSSEIDTAEIGSTGLSNRTILLR